MADASDDGPVSCAGGCGFFGSAATKNMCSKCYREWCAANPQEKVNEATTPTAEPAATTATGEPAAEAADSGNEGTSSSAAVATSDAGESGDGEEAPAVRKVQKNKKKCFVCRKKLGLHGFECRCSYTFCSQHRYADKHDCDFDYHAFVADNLSRDMPALQDSRISHI